MRQSRRLAPKPLVVIITNPSPSARALTLTDADADAGRCWRGNLLLLVAGSVRRAPIPEFDNSRWDIRYDTVRCVMCDVLLCVALPCSPVCDQVRLVSLACASIIIVFQQAMIMATDGMDDDALSPHGRYQAQALRNITQSPARYPVISTHNIAISQASSPIPGSSMSIAYIPCHDSHFLHACRPVRVLSQGVPG
ncbi:hypothetical protein EDB81DRAFT_399975 [Dactylonectria macrodidyma]|uniref:Uncharacterized protein n=1 Tax=Dactylonectria macrodidyma TaxID=307937 RepID=A0A9P9F9Q8_9HYPO|nr:hypothetical protein EDB81DRAFT_399975 [Dactylonectria macrodidyma]